MGKCAIPSNSNVLINPAICSKSNGITDGEIKTRIPMYNHQDVKNHFANTEGIREVGVRLSFVEELAHSLSSEKICCC